jgi:hypothetical protein
MSYSLKSCRVKSWMEKLLSDLTPGDHVLLCACETENSKTEEIFVEIDSFIAQSSKRKDGVGWNYKGIVLDYRRTYDVPKGIINGRTVEFNETHIQSILEWRNTRTKSWKDCRVLSREESGADLTNWYFEEIPKQRLDHLVIGDIVRVLVGDIDISWSKLYLEIFKIDYYTEGGVHRPKKFHGKVMDIYMTDASTSYHMRVGEILEFQRKHIIEVPEWKISEPFLPQPRRELIMKDRKHGERNRNEPEFLDILCI